MNVRFLAMLAAGLLAVVTVSGCSTPTPTPAPPATASPSPLASPATTAPQATATPSPLPSAAAQPNVVCRPYTSSLQAAVTLTCENAVEAAKAVVGSDAAVAYIEFGHGRWCPAGSACIPFMPNEGWVVFHRKGLLPDLLVSVSADATDKVTAKEPTPLPSPSPS